MGGNLGGEPAVTCSPGPGGDHPALSPSSCPLAIHILSSVPAGDSLQHSLMSCDSVLIATSSDVRGSFFSPATGKSCIYMRADLLSVPRSVLTEEPIPPEEVARKIGAYPTLPPPTPTLLGAGWHCRV
ncbi:unnamed protein product [Arctogadus glacialis]